MFDQDRLSQSVLQALTLENPYRYFRQNPTEKNRLFDQLESVTHAYQQAKTDVSCYEVHKTLNTLYDYQINAYAAAPQYDPILMEIMLELETAWIDYEKTRVPEVEAPTDAKEFAAWLREYILKHPSSLHPVFEHLSDDCSFEEMSYFFSQEVTIDPRFDDLIALMQVGIKDQSIKMELASNFWDEMGNGKLEDIHTIMFSKLYDGLDIFKEGETFNNVLERASWQSLAAGNTLLYGVLHRQNFSVSLGSLGTVEMISPHRFRHLVKGFKRLGLSEEVSRYHKTHIKIDSVHGNAWLNHAIVPTIEDDPTKRNEVFMGASYRLNTSHDYCDHMAKQFSQGIH